MDFFIKDAKKGLTDSMREPCITLANLSSCHPGIYSNDIAILFNKYQFVFSE